MDTEINTTLTPTKLRSYHRTTDNFDYPVKLLWKIMPNDGKWNEICAWTIEHMGLPGNRYLTEISQDYMIWYFKDIRDKLMFIIAWGDHNEL